MAVMQAATLLFMAVVPAAALVEGRQAGASVEISNANPIRKVVTMLQSMQKKVEAEGEKEKNLFDKFMCYCKNSGGDLSKSIADSTAKVPTLGADIEAAAAKKKTLAEDLKQHQVDRSAAKEAMAEASAIRAKEAKAFAQEAARKKADISALGGAISSISNGMAGGFLQTRGARILKRLVQVKQDMLEADREDIIAFLSGSTRSGEGYVPQSGQITGILKEMHDEMSRDLADAIAAEKEAITAHDGLMAAKTREVNALTKSIETKTVKNGELAVSIVQMKNDLGDTEAALIEDQKFLADMDKNCDLKSKEWDERSKTRSEELLAISETIKILNDDDALEIFKKTLPGAASFVQVRGSSSSLRAQALKILDAVHSKEPQLEFITLALAGKKIGFEKVLKMVDDMVSELKQEQLDDDTKKNYCNKQFDLSDDKKKELEQNVEDLETSMTEAEDGISTMVSEIKTLKDNTKKLDKSVAEASEGRKEEHEDFTNLMASDSAAKEILKFAINRLNKFYNPKLYKAPAKTELAQVHAHGVAAPPPPPATFGGEYEKKGEQSNGIMAMINLLVKDLDKEMTEAETSEEDSQKDYEQLMQDSADKRAEMKKATAEKEGARAAMQGELEQAKEEKTSTSKELKATKMYIGTLHSSCDWLIQYFDMRKTARSEEVDALGKAKAVLSGADFSLLQRRSRNLRSHL